MANITIPVEKLEDIKRHAQMGSGDIDIGNPHNAKFQFNEIYQLIQRLIETYGELPGGANGEEDTTEKEKSNARE